MGRQKDKKTKRQKDKKTKRQKDKKGKSFNLRWLHQTEQRQSFIQFWQLPPQVQLQRLHTAGRAVPQGTVFTPRIISRPMQKYIFYRVIWLCFQHSYTFLIGLRILYYGTARVGLRSSRSE